MSTTSTQQVGSFLRSIFIDAVPALSVFCLILFSTVPFNLPTAAHCGGLLPLIGITYWTLVRPRNMPPLLTFLLGLLTDIVTFVPFGIHAFIFVLAQAILKRQRRFLVGQGFWVLWAAFSLLTIGVYVLSWFMISLFIGHPFMFSTGLLGAALSWAVLPLIMVLFGKLHELIDLFDEPIS